MLCFENERLGLATRQTMKYQNELANQPSLDAHSSAVRNSLPKHK